MIRGIEGRGEAHASTSGIAHAQAGLALGHRRRGAEPTGTEPAAQPAAIVTLSQQGRALAQRAIEAERAQAAAHRPKGAKRLSSPTLAPAVGPGSLSAGTGGALEAAGAIATRRAIPRGIAKKLATSLSVVAAAPNALAATTQSTTRTAVPALAEPTAGVTAGQRTGRAPAWGHLIRHGGQDAAGADQGARTAEKAPHKAVGRGTLHDDDARMSARALMQAAAARLVAEARTRRDDQKTELTGGPSHPAHESERASREKARSEASAAQRAPQAAQAAVAAAAEQAGLALPTPEASAT